MHLSPTSKLGYLSFKRSIASPVCWSVCGWTVLGALHEDGVQRPSIAGIGVRAPWLGVTMVQQHNIQVLVSDARELTQQRRSRSRRRHHKHRSPTHKSGHIRFD